MVCFAFAWSPSKAVFGLTQEWRMSKVAILDCESPLHIWRFACGIGGGGVVGAGCSAETSTAPSQLRLYGRGETRHGFGGHHDSLAVGAPDKFSQRFL